MPNHEGSFLRNPAGSLRSSEAASYLFMFLHGGVQFLREVIGYIGHAWLLLIAPTQAALVFAGFLIILLFSIFAVSLCYLQDSTRERRKL